MKETVVGYNLQFTTSRWKTCHYVAVD